MESINEGEEQPTETDDDAENLSEGEGEESDVSQMLVIGNDDNVKQTSVNEQTEHMVTVEFICFDLMRD